jgi:hypothetical protein
MLRVYAKAIDVRLMKSRSPPRCDGLFYFSIYVAAIPSATASNMFL